MSDSPDPRRTPWPSSPGREQRGRVQSEGEVVGARATAETPPEGDVRRKVAAVEGACSEWSWAGARRVRSDERSDGRRAVHARGIACGWVQEAECRHTRESARAARLAIRRLFVPFISSFLVEE